ncbi:MAG: hypothetical protein R3C99_12450 [Pirellulaceae bacterium]|nr:hypothetical protein [Planctomycetales bacterium]MCA9209363.1 hypothetical protein [Planctomycetales bacterium]MCA9220065.1 hypothetical protein [Planctomycetales bacterium]MCA9226696.1 hypothetical protein [Planctomycetales bacterium]
MARQVRHAEAPGQDSFLDIVANLVGILIILIMVIGMQAKTAMVSAKPQPGANQTDAAQPDGPDEPAEDASSIDVAGPKSAADAIQADINGIEAKLKEQEFEVEYRRRERNNIHLVMATVEQRLAELRAGLNDSQRDQLDLQTAIAAAEQQLRTLADAKRALETTAATPKVIEHLPTPMAKTVFGKEYHFRLANGRLTYVPMDELVERLKSEAPDKLWKLKDSAQLTETIGPLDGFWLKYTLVRSDYAQPTRTGTAVQTRVELDHFTLVPVSDDLGEPFAVAMQPGSRFRGMLDGLDPKRATVTIWVYPDSFNEFRELKRTLFDRGFLTAGRPMPADMPIGGSPDGSRSAAQ